MSSHCRLIVLCFLICCLIEIITAQNYCDASLCKGKRHIACNNRGGLGRSCAANAKLVPIDGNLRGLIVRRHNALRNRVATGKLNGYKSAARMATMSWDNELAKLAELNVKQCQMTHDQCRNTAAFRNAGQNLAFSNWMGMVRSVKDVTEQHIQDWFNEYKLASMNDINRLSGRNLMAIGHFTAMMQEKSIRVGCAILRQTKNRFTYQYFACNYAVTNMMNQPVYQSGAPASKCTTGKNSYYPGLCSANERYNLR